MTELHENDARPIDYAAHRAGYINRHGEAAEDSDSGSYDDDRYTDYDDDAYPCGEACA